MNRPRTLQELNDRLTLARQHGDPLADVAFGYIRQNPALFAQFQQLDSNAALTAMELPDSLQDLLQDVEQKLKQFDRERLHAGHLVFEKYAEPIMINLAMYSLPYCYAAEQGAQVLVKSKYLLENPQKRLEETGEFLFATGSREAFTDEGFGIIQCLKVRLLHAGARFHAKTPEESSVNQEDLLGTNLAFSLIVIRGFQKMGIRLIEQEEKDFLYLWNCIGELLGIEADLLPTDLREASVLERSIRKRQFRFSEAGARLTNSLIHMYEQNWPMKGTKPADLIATFVGAEIAECIGLKPVSLKGEAALGTMRYRNTFTKFSAATFGKLKERVAQGQFSF